MNITKETNGLICVAHSYMDDEDVESLAEVFDMEMGGGVVVGKGVVVCEVGMENDVTEVIKQFEG
jgi:hypothetical protein